LANLHDSLNEINQSFVIKFELKISTKMKTTLFLCVIALFLSQVLCEEQSVTFSVTLKAGEWDGIRFIPPMKWLRGHWTATDNILPTTLEVRVTLRNGRIDIIPLSRWTGLINYGEPVLNIVFHNKNTFFSTLVSGKLYLDPSDSKKKIETLPIKENGTTIQMK
jgi:hypothetical protein